MRVLILGGPRTGKTTLAESFGVAIGCPVRHTDDLLGGQWSEVSEEVSTWIDEPGPWIIEGVAVVRALRKWLLRNPTGSPCDRVVILAWRPYVSRSEGQERMAKGHDTILAEVIGPLHERVGSVEVWRDRP